MKDKCILITGGGGGIGLACARLLLDAGARVAITGRDAKRLDNAAGALSAGDRVMTHVADVTKHEQVDKLVHAVTAKFGHINVLVNNAGTNIKKRAFQELTPESWHNLIDANLHGAFYCIRAVLPAMRRRKDGLIININSISGKRSNPLGGVGYNTAKFGLRALAMGLAAEERENGIRICSIFPGEVDTPILDNRPKPLTDEQRRRILKAEDVAQAVLFVASLPPRATVPELVITPAAALYL